MPYQSPLHILDSLHITPNELTPEGITRLRKKLLAEFSLSSDITINVNGQAYTKDEILKVIDQLKEVDNLVLHKAIFNRKPLLDWLENPQKGFFPQDLAQEVLDENLENDFYQSMLQNSMAEYVKVHFKKRHFARLQMAMDFWENLQEEYRYEIHDVIYSEIQVIVDEIEYAQQKPKVRENKERFGFISEPQWTDFLNNLPENFEGIREAYCYAAVNYTVAIQRKDRVWTYEISSQLEQTLCEGSIRDTIKSNHLIYTENFHTTAVEEKSRSWGGWFWVVFVIVRLLFYANSCSKHSSSSNSYSVPPTYDTYSSSEPPPEIAPDEPNKVEKIEKEYGQIKLPANTFYIVQIQNYQKALIKNNYPHEGQKISVMKGANVLENLNLGNTEEHIDAPIRVNPQMITFKNLTDYDLVIFKAGCNANRSFFINSKETYWIETCSGDLFYFYFYFGKNWLQNYPNISGMQMDEKKRFQGYFSVSHKNTNTIFMKEYSFNPSGKEPTVTFDNVTIEKNIMPTATALGINENDTSIILQ